MGMFNEVLKSCPSCGARAMAQIRQVVLGFGNFDLDQPESLARHHTLAELRDLEDAVRDESTWFECSCGHRFRLLDDIEAGERRRLAERLSRLGGSRRSDE